MVKAPMMINPQNKEKNKIKTGLDRLRKALGPNQRNESTCLDFSHTYPNYQQLNRLVTLLQQIKVQV